MRNISTIILSIIFGIVISNVTIAIAGSNKNSPAVDPSSLETQISELNMRVDSLKSTVDQLNCKVNGYSCPDNGGGAQGD